MCRHGFQHVLDVVAQLLRILKAGGEEKVVDMDNLLKREALDVIGRVGFGYDMGATKALEGGDNAQHALEIADAAALEVEMRWAEPYRQYKWWSKGVREGVANQGKYHALMRNLLADVKARAAAGELLDSSVAGHLLRLRDPKTGKQLPDELLLPEIATFFFAGEDTTSHTGAFTLYCVSQHPEVEAKIVEELGNQGLLATADAPQPRPLQYEDLSRLTYLNLVIKEAMRMYPVAGGTVRMPKKDVLLGGKYLIPKGTTVFLPLHAIHNCRANYEEPDKFLPERWLEPGAEYARPRGAAGGVPSGQGGEAACTNGHVEGGRKMHDSSSGSTDGRARRFLPFMEGPRSCAGLALANMNLTATLALLYGHFSFRLADEMGGPEGVRAGEHLTVTMSCDKGMKMHAISRSA
ncbi:cytochrome P450 [Coccomyxa subellipsoidea C-169]|uniref:Cytochrome P450 n=1 Tax=Coccomyxa subellipsoidea (strain C-169) TaxID=574566 RepID=I0YLP5_COCSC|nr:cytochrome P450 [Coccomyxa subellipsoidea C-169]EIE19314.1 cytochrome P450 [Coccomyxa subellipsoidea C-169]|eukprot:XP_005643858.1 cytochrome P450 [Coccomyxa subellipsoidea C-169]